MELGDLYEFIRSCRAQTYRIPMLLDGREHLRYSLNVSGRHQFKVLSGLPKKLAIDGSQLNIEPKPSPSYLSVTPKGSSMPKLF